MTLAMNILFSLSATRANVLIGSVYKILTELFSNLLMSLIEFNCVFSTLPFQVYQMIPG